MVHIRKKNHTSCFSAWLNCSLEGHGVCFGAFSSWRVRGVLECLTWSHLPGGRAGTHSGVWFRGSWMTLLPRNLAPSWTFYHGCRSFGWSSASGKLLAVTKMYDQEGNPMSFLEASDIGHWVVCDAENRILDDEKQGGREEVDWQWGRGDCFLACPLSLCTTTFPTTVRLCFVYVHIP